MAVTTVNEVADFFIHEAHEVGDPISHLKLQKLVYYAQAWHLAVFDQPLIDDRFEAWVHGPVCPPLYERFKGNSWKPIATEVEAPELKAELCDHLSEVQAAYGAFSALELERLTHSEDPWIAARGDLAPTEPSNAVISNESMRRFYAARMA